MLQLNIEMASKVWLRLVKAGSGKVVMWVVKLDGVGSKTPVFQADLNSLHIGGLSAQEVHQCLV